MDNPTLYLGCIFFLFSPWLEGAVGSPVDQNNASTSPWNEFIEEFKNIANSAEKIDALRNFALRQEAEKKRAIDEIIVAKAAEKKQAVEAMETKMLLGTLLCAMSYMNAAIEHVYRDEVEKFNTSNWRRERPLEVNSDEELSAKIDPYYHKWLEFVLENRSGNRIRKFVRSRLPQERQLVDFAWSMPKIYLFSKDYVHGKRSKSMQQYKSLRESGTKKSTKEFLREHSTWIFLKSDLNFVNVLLEAVKLDPVGYEWLDKRSDLVIPFSAEESCWPSDKYFYVPSGIDEVVEQPDLTPSEERLFY